MACARNYWRIPNVAAMIRWRNKVATYWRRSLKEMGWSNPPGWGTEEQPSDFGIAMIWLGAAGGLLLGVIFLLGGISGM